MMEGALRQRRMLLVCAGFALFFVAFFGPVLFTGKLMASGDAIIESLPGYLGPHHLWEPLILLGYPMYADPNQVYWYPPDWLRFIPHTYNLFAVMPFWLAAIGTFGLVRTLTRSTAAGLIAGVGFSLGGFMISHSGHLMITHPAAWSPYALWSLEELRRDARRRWFVLLAISIALCALGGQPQVLAFTLALGLFYALVSTAGATGGRWLYLRRCALGSLLGLGAGAIGLIPQALLAHESLRQTLSFDQFVTYSATFDDVLLGLAFPYLPQLLPAFTELTNFAGLGMLSLALLGLLARDLDRRVWFWAAVAIGALALSTGDALGIASLTYHLPLYDHFRIPGRHAFEFTLATAILAGYGTAALQRGAGPARCLAAVLAIGALVAAALFVAGRTGAVNPIADAMLAPALYAYAVTGIALLVWSIRPESRVLCAIALAVVAGELGYFGEQAYWRTEAFDPAGLRAPAIATDLTTALRTSGRRAFWAPGMENVSGLTPNLSLLWGVPTVPGYTPLVVARVAHLLDLSNNLTVGDGASLDIAGAQFVVAPAGEQSTKPASDPFNGRDLQIFIGNAKLATLDTVRLGTLQPVRANRIAMVSSLSESTEIPDGAPVAWLHVTDARGREVVRAILAGRDTAEMAFDRPDVRPQVRHRRAPVFSSFDVNHQYLAAFATGLTERIDHVTIQWTYPGVSAMSVDQLALIDDRAHVAYPLGSLSLFYGERRRFQTRPDDGGFSVLENVRALPRAWTVRRLEYATPGDAFSTIHRGVTHDGRPFDPRVTAFVEGPGATTAVAGGSVATDVLADSRLRLIATCPSRCFVVSSDAWYPGWQARIDGAPAPLIRSDGALRGLFVPAGRHVIDEHFMPFDLLLGAFCSLIALVGIAAKILWWW